MIFPPHQPLSNIPQLTIHVGELTWLSDRSLRLHSGSVTFTWRPWATRSWPPGRRPPSPSGAASRTRPPPARRHACRRTWRETFCWGEDVIDMVIFKIGIYARHLATLQGSWFGVARFAIHIIVINNSLFLSDVDVAALAHPDGELVASKRELTSLVGTTVADCLPAFSGTREEIPIDRRR